MSTESENQVVTLAHRDDVAIIRIDDGKANAIGFDLMDQLSAALIEAEEASAVAIIGRQRMFSAGFDLSVIQDEPSRAFELVDQGARLALDIFMWKRPVVLGVTGHSLAMGAVLLCSADVRIGSAGNFKIGFNEVAIGMAMPEFAVVLAETRLIPAQIQSAVALAHIYDPQGAVSVGFLDEIVEPDATAERAIDRSAELAKYLNPGAFRGTRHTTRDRTAERLRQLIGLADAG